MSFGAGVPTDPLHVALVPHLTGREQPVPRIMLHCMAAPHPEDVLHPPTRGLQQLDGRLAAVPGSSPLAAPCSSTALLARPLRAAHGHAVVPGREGVQPLRQAEHYPADRQCRV